MVVQWRAPKDINVLVQRFGRAARDFSLQAVVILIAELKWFLEEHQKKLACKWKRSKKKGGTRKVLSRPRAESIPGASGGNISCSEVGSETDTDMDTNTIHVDNQNPNADKEDVCDVKASIKLIGVMARGKGCKRTTDKVMRLFINAHLLRERKHCRWFHINHFYKSEDICMFSLLKSSDLSESRSFQPSLHRAALVVCPSNHQFVATSATQTRSRP